VAGPVICACSLPRLLRNRTITAWVELAVRTGRTEDDERVYADSLALLAESAAKETRKDTPERPCVEVYQRTALNYGRLLRERGKFAEAEEIYPEAVRLVRQRGHDIFAVELTIGYAKLRAAQQKSVEAQGLFRDAVALAVAEGIKDKATGNPLTKDALCEFGAFLVTVGKPSEAEEAYRRVIDLGLPAGIIHAQQRLFALTQDITWNIRYFAWPDAGARQPPKDWDAAVGVAALATSQTKFVDFSWWINPPHKDVPADHFAVVAATQIDVPVGGKLSIHTLSDDGVRVWIDGNRVIDHWDWHEMAHDSATVELELGRHDIRIEYFDIDGVATLKCSLLPTP
jgi:hypothetical protein